MKIAKIKPVGKMPVYDLSVKDAEHYILENGVVTHNTGIYYSANTIFIMGRQQVKDGKDVSGYNFIINVEKSRFVKEKSKIPISVRWDAGVSKWSGLLDVAQIGGYVKKPKIGWYQACDPATGADLLGKNYRAAETNSDVFWHTIFEKTNFAEWLKAKYTVGHRALFNDGTLEEENINEEA